MGRFPSRRFQVNAAWLELSLTVIDLLAWTQLLLLDGDLATAEPIPATGSCTSPPDSPAAAAVSA